MKILKILIIAIIASTSGILTVAAEVKPTLLLCERDVFWFPWLRRNETQVSINFSEKKLKWAETDFIITELTDGHISATTYTDLNFEPELNRPYFWFTVKLDRFAGSFEHTRYEAEMTDVTSREETIEFHTTEGNCTLRKPEDKKF